MLGDVFSSIELPEIDYEKAGGRIGIFGSFDSASLYEYQNASLSFDNSFADTVHSLYIRDTTSNRVLRIASLNGIVSQIIALDSDTVVLNGNFSKLNNQTADAPIVYNLSSTNIELIASMSSESAGENPLSLAGTVNTILHHNDLLYLGGNFEYNETYGAAIYNLTSKLLISTPFQGFGKNSSVNTIIRVFDEGSDNDDEGSIIFGGSFTTLGLSELLLHNDTTNSNKTKHNNETNSSVISAEQQVSLRNGLFTNVNGDDDDTAIICPSSNRTWSLKPGVGGEWAVELPDEMKGIVPTKVRLFIPDDKDGTSLFRIYTYPNNGIMNLTYIDPSTNEVAYCDAWCPLLSFSDLQSYTEENAEEFSEDIEDFEEGIYIDENGSLTAYYQPQVKTKTIGYGSNYQDFAFLNTIAIEKIGLTILQWYGSKAMISGFELYLDNIVVYANDTLNAPNCASDDQSGNYVTIDGGSWNSVLDVTNASLEDLNYLVSETNSESEDIPQITFYPNISYSGNYSIILNTPGCIQDESCDKRSIINVSVLDAQDSVLSNKIIYQNNDYEKFDYLFYGHLNGTTETNGRNKIVVSYNGSVYDEPQSSWVVMDKVVCNIVHLDNNTILHSKANKSEVSENDPSLKKVPLNGIFEYSLANFSSFDTSTISYKDTSNKTIIKRSNNYVANTSVNLIGTKLSKNANVSQLATSTIGSTKLISVLGDFSTNLSLENNLLFFELKKFNSVLNETETIDSRNSSSSEQLNRLLLSGGINGITSNNDSLILYGNFSMSSNSSVAFHNLTDSERKVKNISNVAVYHNDTWYGLGNEAFGFDVNTFANISVNSQEFYVFSSSDSKNYATWNNSGFTFIPNAVYGFNVSQATVILQDYEVLSGTFFNIMDIYSRNQFYFDKNESIKTYNFDVRGGEILHSLYVNESISAISGNLKSQDMEEVGVLLYSLGSLQLLEDQISWTRSTHIQCLFADSDILFIGGNGSVILNGDERSLGLLVYDLRENSFNRNQPASLQNADGPLLVSSIAYSDEKKQILVGGNFTSAGSLSCAVICVYDLQNTRWVDQSSSVSSSNLEGYATNMKFISKDEVLISGDFKVDGNKSHFITYDIEKRQFSTNNTSSLNTLNADYLVNDFVIRSNDSKDKMQLIALGNEFVVAFDGKAWKNIDSPFLYDENTKFTDSKLLTMKGGSSDKIFVLSGTFQLSDYGNVNLAFYNGSTWRPLAFTKLRSTIGGVNSILAKDSMRLLSLNEVENFDNLSRGKVVGISLACALGTTSLMGALYAIPFFLLFKRKNDQNQRIQESEMMNMVNPESLLHEIDLQKQN